MLKQSLNLAGASALLASLLAAPIAADIIAYRTEDGVFAYTDDHDKVPARYAHDAVTVRDTKLHGYPRLTVEDTKSARAVSTRLEKRLDYLRQVNAASHGEREVAKTAAENGPVLTIPTAANESAPSIAVAAEGGNGPIVVEPILSKATNDARTRRTTLVKQGGKVLAIVKGPQHNFDVTSDIHDEDALEHQR